MSIEPDPEPDPIFSRRPIQPAERERPFNDAQRDTFRYALRARLDVGGLRPIVTLSESGEIALAPARR